MSANGRRRRQVSNTWLMRQPIGAPSGFAREHAEALAWGRWARQGGSGAARCGSAEGQYISGYGDGNDNDDQQDAVSISEDRAQLFERAVLSLSYAHRRFLLVAYVNREQRKSVCEKCRVSAEMLEACQLLVLRDLVEAVERLDQPKLIRKGKMLWAGLARSTSPGI